MPASPHDLRLSAALVPITADLRILLDQLTYLCSDLGMGAASSEQRLSADTRCGAVARELDALRAQLIPGASITVEGS